MPNSTRRQHHVWRSYLEAWATKGKVFCLQNGRVFKVDTKNVAVERDFYKLQTLTNVDIKGIRLMMKDMPSSAKPILENFLTMFALPGRLKSALAKSDDPIIRSQLEYEIINAEERYHALLEGNIKPIYDAIKLKDLSFYDDPQLCGQFVHFLSLQNLRTKGVREKVIARTPEQLGFSVERCWNVLTHIMAVNAGGGLMVERKNRPLLLLENHTSIPFITSDQPVVNLLHSPVPNTPPKLLAFYYPVSPCLAIILDEVEARTGFQSGPLDTPQVTTLNQEIIAASHSQVFGSSRTVLTGAD